MDNTDILTIDEVAKYLRVSGRTVYDWAQKGQIPAGKIGNVWRFQKAELEAWVNDRLTSSGKTPRVKKHEDPIEVFNASKFLTPKRVLFFDEVDRETALSKLASLLSRSKEVHDPTELLQEVQKRESLMSTAVGNGIAIPHVRLTSIDNLVAAVGISRAGIKDYLCPDGSPVNIMIMVAAGVDQHDYYLRVISYFSAKLKLEELREKLITAKSDKEAFSLL